MQVSIMVDGTEYKGTPDDLAEILRAISLGKTYISDNKGILRIEDMNTHHIRNALLKKYRDWCSELSRYHGIELLLKLENDPTVDDIEFVNLLEAYIFRVNTGE